MNFTNTSIYAITYLWDFGDGTIFNSNADTLWHKYTGDSINYIVKVTSTNPMGCSFVDSTIVKIRNVKAQFYDTLFCKKINPNECEENIKTLKKSLEIFEQLQKIKDHSKRQLNQKSFKFKMKFSSDADKRKFLSFLDSINNHNA